MKKEGHPVAANVEKLLASGQKSWYADDPKMPSARPTSISPAGTSNAVAVPAGVWSVEVAKKVQRRGQENSSASLVDLGDGVACIESTPR